MASLKLLAAVLVLCLLATCLEAKKDPKKTKGSKKSERAKHTEEAAEEANDQQSKQSSQEESPAENAESQEQQPAEQQKDSSEADNQEVKQAEQEQAGDQEKQAEDSPKEEGAPEEAEDAATPSSSSQQAAGSDSAGAQEANDEKLDSEKATEEKLDSEKAAEEKVDSERVAASGDGETTEEEQNGIEGKAVKPAFKCNLSFKRVGCFNDKAGKERPLSQFIMNDAKLGLAHKKSSKAPSAKDFDKELPEFACKCANAALKRGNAVFGVQNLVECWSGRDDSKYDRDGKSDSCVTYGYKPCADSSDICAGNKNANFVYYVDTESHTKSKVEMEEEMAKLKKAQKAMEKAKKAAAAKKAKKEKKKAAKKADLKKSKKHGKHH